VGDYQLVLPILIRIKRDKEEDKKGEEDEEEEQQ